MTNTFWVLASSLAIGFALGGLGRAFLRSRVRLSWPDAVLAGLLGAVAGSLVGSLFPGGPRPVAAGLVAVLGTAAALLGMERIAARRRRVRGSVDELIRAGESATVEFKSSARYNRHSGKRDEHIEHAVAKTIAGFLNAEGGVLLVGVADDGSISGLEDDYTVLKAGNRDRFELWLRDMLGLSIGLLAITDLQVDFERVDGHDVSRISVPAARRPVFVHTPGSQHTSLFVRSGNSTRELDVETALTYCVDRWGRQALRGSGLRGARH